MTPESKPTLDQTINRSWNPACPCCKKQMEKVKGAMHTKRQRQQFHPVDKDSYVDPKVKRT